MNWWRGLKVKVRIKEPLKDYTAFKIGGRAKYFAQPRDTGELKLLLGAAKIYAIPVFVLGKGSNLLIGDKGVSGLVLSFNAPFFKRVRVDKSFISASCGAALSGLIAEAGKNNLGGLEFLAGIPGAVGGALAMNAGAWGKNIGDLVENATVMDYNGNIKTLRKGGLKFGYRFSNLSKYIILEASFKLSRLDAPGAKGIIAGYLNRRRQAQDLSSPSAGCVFRNPAGRSAGKLIDLCGLKGRSSGRASISNIHANFILNKGGASSRDVLKLMDLAKSEVKKKFKVDLKPEIKIWQ